MSTLLYDGNGAPAVGLNGEKYPDLPLGTYFANAGLSHAEAVSASDACLARAKQLLTAHLRALEDREPQRARQYRTDHNLRAKLNQKVIATALLEMGFDSRELLEIDRGLQIGLLTPEKFVQTARVSGPTGSTEFEIAALDPKRENGKTVLLTDTRTGAQQAH